MIRSLRDRLLKAVFGPLRRFRRKAIAKGHVVYYPVFDSKADLSNHYLSGEMVSAARARQIASRFDESGLLRRSSARRPEA